jgi:predicted outer membrane repeat protein
MRNRSNPRGRASYVAEPLEPRITLSIFTVMNTLDNGAGSLRQAILDADAAMGPDEIQFDASFSSSQHTITFTSATPQMNGQLTITGPGASLLTVTRSGNVTASSNVFNSFATSLTMSGMTVRGGNIAGSGGGLSVGGVTPNITLDSMHFALNNASGNGGAISLTNNASLTIRNSQIADNTAGALGGGIFFFQGGSLVMQNCLITGNTASGASVHDASGGGIYFDGTALASPPAGYTPSTLLVQSSTFYSNSGAHAGGGIAADEFNGTMVLQNSTMDNNTAGTSGGAIWCTGTTATNGSVALQDCTVAYNTANSSAAGTGGGGVARVGSFAGSITLIGSIVYGNSNPAGAPDVFASSFTTTNVNFCDIGSSAGFTLAAGSGGNLPFGTDPMLGALATNGGPTLTMALLPGSPAINTGVNIGAITTDQRGIARPQGPTADIGAYERQATAATLTSMSYEYLTRQAITFNFSSDASVTFSRSSYTILNQTTNQTLASSIGSLTWDFTGTQATLLLTNLLSDANYHVTSGASTLDFFVLAGDANHDRHVNAIDFTALAQNFNQSSATFAQGNFNYDAKVNALDFNILATKFGTTLAPPSPSAAVASNSPESFAALSAVSPSLFNDKPIYRTQQEIDIVL